MMFVVNLYSGYVYVWNVLDCHALKIIFVRLDYIYYNFITSGINFNFNRYSNFVAQNVMLHLRRRKIQEKSNGLKHTEKQLEKNWGWTHLLNLKGEGTFLSNIIENYGIKQS